MTSTNNGDDERPEVGIDENAQTSTPKTLSPQHRRDSRIKSACSECKRRKVRCDGTHPCYFCRHYKQPERCVYTLSRPALILSRKNFDAVRSRLEIAADILKKLFPSLSIDTLSSLSRGELLDRLGPAVHGRASQTEHSLGGTDNVERDDEGFSPSITVTDREARSSQENEIHGERPSDYHDTSSEVGDDVNALSATSNHASSYVGPSSTMQMFRTILRIAPESLDQRQFSQSPTDVHQNMSLKSPETGDSTLSAVRITERTSQLIEAYFQWIHPATPILDEIEFRQTLHAETRNDAPWLCLQNMVLALGSIGCTTTDSREHILYYNASKSHLDLESLGNKCLETLQALILMAGWYCHYRNRPNLASVLLGAAFRMAYALGLHKESSNCSLPVEAQELRRKIWWSLVAFEAAEAVTLGRTLDTSIFKSEVKYPREVNHTVSCTSSSELQKLTIEQMDGGVVGPSAASTLITTIEFSRILTEVQGSLMMSTPLPFTDTLSLDAYLVDWYETSPVHLHKPTSLLCSSNTTRFVQPFSTIKWRYLTLRTMLYRPSLMEAVLKRIPFSNLTPDQRLCVRKCITLSGEMLESVNVRSSEQPNQYIAWPATWYLLQACMVPLLCLYVFRADGYNPDARQDEAHGSRGRTDFRHPDLITSQVHQIREDSHRQIQTTLRLMKDMEPWAIASKRMHDLISLLYSARDQSLRVWNNSEECPMIVLGSPEIQLSHQSCPSSSRGVRDSQPNRQNPRCDTFARVGGIEASDNGPSASQGLFANQFEQLSKDWSMYNGFAWPNATLETLFDLPDDFQLMDESTYTTA